MCPCCSCSANLDHKAARFVLKFTYMHIRTLGDVLCDNSVMDGTQKWVTLQPDSDYNPREKCKEKRRLDLEGITREIVDEISDNRRSNERGGRRGRGGGRGGRRGGRNLKKGPFSPACLNINCNSV